VSDPESQVSAATFDVHPPKPRWTHVAVPASDLDASIAWYEDFTPLRLLQRREDADGVSAWLGDPDLVDAPFVLVLVSFFRDRGAGPLPTMAPFAHIGIEMTSRAEVDAIAERARAAGCLSWEPQQMPAPIGYICAATDPDGNVVEFSHDQGVYAAARATWG
jgi:catechol 2,3-dioxygenase-like lactoylglutathione lyase family enzyme